MTKKEAREFSISFFTTYLGVLFAIALGFFTQGIVENKLPNTIVGISIFGLALILAGFYYKFIRDLPEAK